MVDPKTGKVDPKAVKPVAPGKKLYDIPPTGTQMDDLKAFRKGARFKDWFRHAFDERNIRQNDFND